MELLITKKLTEKNIPFRLIPLDQPAMSVADVVTFSHGQVAFEEICKTIIVKGRKSSKRYGILLYGQDKVNFTKVKKVIGEEATMADATDVKEVAGVEPGAVCPFLLTVPLFVDQKVEKMTRVNCGSGDHLFGIEFDMRDLKRGVQYTVEDFVK